MLVAIRVDASTAMGTGHLRRCLSLAQALREAGADVRLICRRLDDVSEQVLAAAAVMTHWLPPPTPGFVPETDAPPHAAWAGVPQEQDVEDTLESLVGWAPDWLVVDHYALDARWHRAVREALGCRLLVIDDTADRALDADVLLDHNWSPDHRAKYTGLLRREPSWLCGPRFAVLSAAYRQAPRYSFSDTVHSIGIFMGGTDPAGASARALAAARAAGFDGPVEVASTSANPQLASLREACQRDANATLTLDQPDLAAFFARHDLQIGAGGGATWERCCIGAPTIALALATNQDCVLDGTSQLGIVLWCRELRGLPQWIHDTIADRALRESIHQNSIRLIDGRGALRIAAFLLGNRIYGADQPSVE